MEQIKGFIKNPKITSILGLIGGLAMLISSILANYVYDNYRFNYFIIFENLFKIGLIVYFLIISTRLFFKKGNLKIANYSLIGTLVLNIVFMFLFSHGKIISALVFVCVLLYFLNILFNKKTHINNKIFALILGGYSIINTIMFCISISMSMINISDTTYWIINYISYLLIIPYFYGYYELKEEE